MRWWPTGLLVLLALLLIGAGCSGGRPTSGPSTAGATATASTPGSATPSPGSSSGPARCAGVSYGEVKGPPPSYSPQRLRGYPAARTVCDAYWVPQSDRDFVAQSLAVTGDRAYVGGYRWAPTFARRPCQIAVLDLATGKEQAFLPKFQASVYRAKPTYCRHGGGMQLGSDGLWVQETQRLWLLDPAKVGRGDPVRRVWRMGRGLRGSAMVIQGGRLGVASFRVRGHGRMFWFRIEDLLRRGVDDLVLSGDQANQVRPVGRVAVPRLLQGITSVAGRLWYSTSGTGCAQLVHPSGRRTGFVPGSEGLQFVGRDLWAVSESGARPYAGQHHASSLPVLFRLDRSAALRTPADCRQ